MVGVFACAIAFVRLVVQQSQGTFTWGQQNPLRSSEEVEVTPAVVLSLQLPPHSKEVDRWVP